MTSGKLHIAFIHKDFPFSGAEQVTYDVANYLCAQGYRVTIFAYQHHPEKYKVKDHHLFEIKKLPSKKIKYALSNAKFIKKTILAEKIDVLVAYKELLYFPWLKKQTHIKYVFELHSMPNFDASDIEHKMEQSCFIRIIYSLGIKWLLQRFYDAKYNRIYHNADAYGVLCHSYKTELIEKLGVSKQQNKFWVLPNAIAPITKVEWEKKHTIVYVGRLSRRDKRIDRLLRIWKQVENELPEWQLKLIGNGPEENNLKSYASNLQLMRVSFEGFSTNVQRYYDEATCICLTSDHEGWPLVLAEAQANGVIPIAFDSFSGIHELISNENEGVCVPAFYEEIYAQELIKLLQDKERMSRMQKAVIKKARTYSLERTGAAWIEMLNSIY